MTLLHIAYDAMAKALVCTALEPVDVMLLGVVFDWHRM
jgi:hypothetical protein